nr:JAB domain-containing protein [Escherichia coli]
MSYGVLCHDGPLLPAAGLRPAASGMQRHYAHHRLNGGRDNATDLNNQNQLIAGETLFTGTINRTEVHPREVIKRALYHNAAAVVLAHNHPSGEVTPSKADRLITERLVQALGLVDIRVPDHLIVGGSQVFSFAEHGLL